MDGSGWPDNLSERSKKFLGRYGRRVDSTSDVMSRAPGWALDALNKFESEYGGIAFPVLGGELQGWLRLGVRSGRVWRASSDEWIFNCAEPQFLQCGLVCRMDGYFGVSWSGEFLPWHASVRQLIEASAIWSGLVGWTQVAYCEGNPEHVVSVLGGLRGVSVASSAQTAWWLGDGLAVYSEPYLTYAQNRVRRVRVLAADRLDGQEIRQLISAGERESGYSFREYLKAEAIEEPSKSPFSRLKTLIQPA